jgi:hypothetical protein
MKKILMLVLIICSSNMIKAQDTLSMRTGVNILVKVIEIGTTEVKYKKQDNLNGPIFSILKSDLLLIKYENGTKDDYSNIKKIVETNFMILDDSVQGKLDAQRFYNGSKTATIIAGILPSFGLPLVRMSSALGLIVPSLAFSIAATSKIPKDENLNYPNSSLMRNEKYANSYRHEAKKIKNRKIWTSFAGSITGIGVLFLLGSAIPFK